MTGNLHGVKTVVYDSILIPLQAVQFFELVSSMKRIHKHTSLQFRVAKPT